MAARRAASFGAADPATRMSSVLGAGLLWHLSEDVVQLEKSLSRAAQEVEEVEQQP